MNNPEEFLMNPFQNPQNSCRAALNRLYYSKFIQLIYLILIVFCLFDLIWAISHYSSFPNDRLTLIMDLCLNLIILLDSLLRLYTYGFVNFCNCRENALEIIVMVLAFPEVILLVFFMVITTEISNVQYIISIAFGGFVIILRPIVFCKRQTGTNVKSIYLPNSVIVVEEDKIENIVGPNENRIDCADEDITSFFNRRSV